MTASRHFQFRIWHGALLSVAAVVALVFLLPGGMFLSAADTDLVNLFAAWRAFAAEGIRAGHLPLWNPYAYSGQPFLGDLQSAELYPLNAIFLIMPLARAVNLSFLLHLLILGWGAGYWAVWRGCRPWAGALAGFALMLSGPVFPHLYGGHLTNVCAMAWAPWIFCALEAAWRGPVLKPLLLGMAAVALQILAGNPQYVFYTAVAAGLFAVLETVAAPAARWRALPLLAAVYLGGAALAAAQLLPGLAAVGESVRQGTLPYDFVRQVSFPPENLLTMIAPGFFGNLHAVNYWGRAYLWEVSLFAGVSGVVLAGLALGDKQHGARTRRDALLAVLLLVLALGDYTPLLHILYLHAPGFGEFRSLSKFTFSAMLFGTQAIAAGADAVWRGRMSGRFYGPAVSGLGLLAVGVGIYLWSVPGSLAFLFAKISTSIDTFTATARWSDAGFLQHATKQAGASLTLAGVLLVMAGASLLAARRWPKWRWVPVLMLPLEMVGFANVSMGTGHTSDLEPRDVSAFVAAHPGDYRVLNTTRANNGYFLGVPDISGNDPTVLKRYAEFIAYTQGMNPNQALQYAYFRKMPPIMALLRLGYVFYSDDKGDECAPFNNSLPHVLLASDYAVLPGRDAIFAAMSRPDFDPGKTVLLESAPTPAPVMGTKGSARLVSQTSDSLTIEADTLAPSLLLITDLYSKDWRARPLPGSVQASYEILPADYILRAIPLAAGHHELVVEYAPPSFHLGLWLSGLASAMWIALAVRAWRKR
ncbi:MAG TPA: hypothetical protein VK737_07315 [Opitutales bacterium]|jgi:hypothetical protein|nr:hypothetical protein [Opitutales bacterium]